jgi:hypothetical protein
MSRSWVLLQRRVFRAERRLRIGRIGSYPRSVQRHRRSEVWQLRQSASAGCRFLPVSPRAPLLGWFSYLRVLAVFAMGRLFSRRFVDGVAGKPPERRVAMQLLRQLLLASDVVDHLQQLRAKSTHDGQLALSPRHASHLPHADCVQDWAERRSFTMSRNACATPLIRRGMLLRAQFDSNVSAIFIRDAVKFPDINLGLKTDHDRGFAHEGSARHVRRLKLAQSRIMHIGKVPMFDSAQTVAPGLSSIAVSTSAHKSADALNRTCCCHLGSINK